jgi:hypothetical protein
MDWMIGFGDPSIQISKSWFGLEGVVIIGGICKVLDIRVSYITFKDPHK